jgi:hypothetical protein
VIFFGGIFLIELFFGGIILWAMPLARDFVV